MKTTLPPIAAAQLEAYASASGDFNPIHLDETIARAVGLPGVIAHGMWVAGLMSEHALKAAKALVPGRAWRIVGSSYRFRAMTFLGDALTLEARKVEQPDPGSLKLAVEAVRPGGEVCTLGEFELR